MKKKIFAISGSTRKESTSHSIIKHLQENYSDFVDIDLFEGIETLPHFNPSLDDHVVERAVTNFRQRIQNSDAVLFCSPEYVFSLPGSLKNAIEWCVSTTVFTDKPVGIIIAAAHGAKAMESLQLIISTLQAKIDSGAMLLIQGAKGKISAEGHVNSAETKAQINSVINALLAQIKASDSVQIKFDLGQ